MKTLIKFLSLVCLFGLLLACKDKPVNNPQPVQPDPKPIEEKSTVIFLVRHAEKANNTASDPDLSAAGQARAQTLKDSLLNQPIKAIYTTSYKRTNQTAAPLAQAKNLAPIVYNASDYAGLANKIKTENKDQTVLVVGHSNTVLEILEALGPNRPIPVMNDADYNYLFKVTLQEGKQPKAETFRYGL